jgi:quercetin dioxygenase-like cupin family protein
LKSVGRSRIAILIALFAGAVGGATLPAAFGKTVVVPSVVRQALAQTSQAQGAPGRTLALNRVVVEPDAEIVLHRHRGTQIARIQSGVLTYTVLRGSVMVRRGESDQEPRTVRTIQAGQTAPIHAGEWIVEQPSTIHRAANRGPGPVVIYLANLLEKGAPPSTPVTLPSEH